MVPTQTRSPLADTAWQARFLGMLPKIQRFARQAFRNCSAELREELIAQVVADAYIWYRRLVERGREEHAHASVLASFSIKRVGSGLQVGNARNALEPLSRYCQLRTRVRVQSLQRYDSDSGEWREMLVACRQASPAELAAARIDVPHWLSTLSLRDRAVALMLAAGQETRQVAARFNLSPGRISQLRRSLQSNWLAFHGLDVNGCELNGAAA